MKTKTYKLLILLSAICLNFLGLNAETVTLFNDNGRGGIHKSTGKTTTVDGQYYVDVNIPLSNGKTKTERLKVYRIKDNVRLLYDQGNWAAKYSYVAESSNRIFYYFNMKSSWKPSLTQDTDDPNRIVPIKKLMVYYDNLNGVRTPMKVVLIKTQGKYMLYYGDDKFAAGVESNANPLDRAPAWSKNFKYRSKISGFDVFFNINSKQ